MLGDPRSYLRGLLDKAVRLAAPEHCVPKHLPNPPKGRTLVVSVGKAAASMARAVELHWPTDAPLNGVALTRYGHGCPCDRIEVIEASHPVPDNRGHEAAQKIAADVAELTKDDLLLFLVSGGGSSLLALPADGIELEEKKRINKALLMSGAPIGEMNIVRKHLSAVKGGRLAKIAWPARVVTLAISDVPHDDPSTIASGPTVPDESTSDDALALLDRYQIEISNSIRSHLKDCGSESIKASDPIFDNCSFVMVATPSDMLSGVADLAQGSSFDVKSLGADIEGEARAVAQAHAAIALKRKNTLLLSGGETTVTVETGTTPGKGGRNCEYLLALAITLDGAPNIFALAADTDGIDGSETNAGAIITPDTIERGRSAGMDADDYLARHDSFSFFERLGDLVTTGPTRTNVNDFRAIWIG